MISIIEDMEKTAKKLSVQSLDNNHKLSPNQVAIALREYAARLRRKLND